MNLAAIKRVDPYAKDIVDTSAHVAFYTFNSEENEWEKTDVEGAFFIYSRNAEPFHSIFINNRLNTNSFVEPITSQLELQSQPPFLLYRNERSRIRGFWFYNSSECERIGELVSRLVKECEAKVSSSKGHEMVKPTTMAPNNVDIFSMLSKAQEDFNKAQNQVKTGENRMPLQPPLPPQQQQQQPQQASAIQPDVTSQSVMNFFAAAKPAAASEVPLFQRLFSNPVSVDQIEKQQRATTPLDGKTSPTHPLGIVQTNNSIGALESNMNLMRLNSPKQQPAQDMGTSSLAKFLNSSNLGLPLGTPPPSHPEMPEISQKSLQQLLKKDSSNLPGQSNTTKPALMPPTMFLSSSSKTSKEPPTQSTSNLMRQQSEPCGVHVAAGPLTKPEPLTQTQLLQAMLYLIQNDPEFIKKLHEAYLKSFTDIVSL